MHILIVEDERDVAGPIERTLRHAGLTTTAARTTRDALALSRVSHFDLVLLDLELCNGDGHAVCHELQHELAMPVVMLTRTTRAADRDARSEGADDYILKSAQPSDMIARIRGVLKRSHAAPAPGVLDIGPLHIDAEEERVELGGAELALSPKELKLLARLARDAGSVVSREQLMDDVWGAPWFGSTKTLDVHIGWLRRKLGDDTTAPRFIHTVRGVGFRLALPQRERERELERV